MDADFHNSEVVSTIKSHGIDTKSTITEQVLRYRISFPWSSTSGGARHCAKIYKRTALSQSLLSK